MIELVSAGFGNYPTERWRYSVGERYWAAVTCVTPVRYCLVNLPYRHLKSLA